MSAPAFSIGPHAIRGRCVLAPMAGLTDQPFRNLCRRHGAALAVAEMTTADTALWDTAKSSTRLHFAGENGLRVAQIAGSEPEQMASAARAATELGADIIDINMGCPAKKVCNKLSGSALLQDEALVAAILRAVTHATPVPVTLKIRTGWNTENRNGVTIAKIAEDAGIQSLSVHGRTRACMFRGDAEYATIRAIKAAVSIPVIANGDVTDARKAREVLHYTGADAIMIGRGALGRPWIFREINQLLQDTSAAPQSTVYSADEQQAALSLSRRAVRDIMVTHLCDIHDLYGEYRGVRIGRKHLSWYCKYLEGAGEFRHSIVRVESAAAQLQLTQQFFDQ
ncbi:MAG: tRNA dihydrouridine synthase DusB [Gammaproteobacteria bacterium]|jgi:tRNA-dihydrouridine synthase B|nr:tRNA dihydrouridine synthase DusB [Gammaproteobacteria bacterium]